MTPNKVTVPDLGCMVTDGAMRLVEEAVNKAQTKNKDIILGCVCAEMERRYPGESLEYHLSQMKISSTKDVMEIIELFLIMREMDPSVTFIRKSRTGSKPCSSVS